MEKLIAMLFLARDIAHREHLKTRSFAAHMALDGFYTDIISKADAIAEAYQGRFQLLTDIPYLDNSVKGDIVAILKSHVDWIESNRYKAVDESEAAIQNLIDEAVEVYLSALYKLRFLS